MKSCLFFSLKIKKCFFYNVFRRQIKTKTLNQKISVKRKQSASPPIEGTFDIEFEDGIYDTIYDVPANISNYNLTLLFENVDGITKVSTGRWVSCSRFAKHLYQEN